MRKLLIVVDYQCDFVDGALGFPAAAMIDARIGDKIREARAVGGDVLFTLDTHGADYADTVEGRNLPVPHCIKGTAGHALYGSAAELAREGKTLEKPTFGSAELINILQRGAYSEVELCGVVTNICVISNAVIAKAALPEARIIIDASACASNDAALESKALDILENLHIEVTNRG